MANHPNRAKPRVREILRVVTCEGREIERETYWAVKHGLAEISRHDTEQQAQEALDEYMVRRGA